jgi:hypothetical protein
MTKEKPTEAERAAANQKARARSAERRAEKAARDEQHRKALYARWRVHHEARQRAEDKIVVSVIGKLRPDLEMAYICGESPKWFEPMIWKCKSDAMSEAMRAAPRYPRSEDDPSAAEHAAFNEAYLPAYAAAFTSALMWALRKHDRDAAKEKPRV